jgi:hypothetical protein
MNEEISLARSEGREAQRGHLKLAVGGQGECLHLCGGGANLQLGVAPKMGAVMEVVGAGHEILPELALRAHAPREELGAVEAVGVDHGEPFFVRVCDVWHLWLVDSHKEIIGAWDVA